ncbi:anti-sigma regulatory factor [Streptomyces cremeus]|uniref:Anti-sigma regulatory factor n=1 Tax=Streptomyces cremeus TaxID=66881 RepID=A0ABV5P631_STRCM
MKEYDVDAGQVETILITTSGDVVKARQAVRTQAQRTGLSLVNQTKLVTAASELGRNTLLYGGGGRARIAVVAQGGRRGVWARFEDEGPGIADMDLALTDGWTSGNGMGLGLSGARRLVDEFEIESAAGRGTTVSVVKWAR